MCLDEWLSMKRYRIYILYLLLNGRHDECGLVEVRGLDPSLYFATLGLGLTLRTKGGCGWRWPRRENLRVYWRRKLSKVINRLAARKALRTHLHNNTIITHDQCLPPCAWLYRILLDWRWTASRISRSRSRHSVGDESRSWAASGAEMCSLVK